MRVTLTAPTETFLKQIANAKDWSLEHTLNFCVDLVHTQFYWALKETVVSVRSPKAGPIFDLVIARLDGILPGDVYQKELQVIAARSNEEQRKIDAEKKKLRRAGKELHKLAGKLKERK